MNHPIEKDAEKEVVCSPAIAAGKNLCFAGSAAVADSAYVRRACMKTSGGCLATGLPGNVPIAVVRMVSATNDFAYFFHQGGRI
jgi:hypothetical protein